MAEETQQEQEQPQLGVVDIQNCLQIIDVASRRGAFQGNELSQVGQVRDKLATFIDSVLPKNEEGEVDEEAAQTAQEQELKPETKKKTSSGSGRGRKKTASK